MPSTNDPIIVQIVDSVNASIGKSSSSSSGGALAAGGKIAGIFTVVSEIASLVRDAVSGILKPIRTIILGILKLTAQLLRPFADMIMILLIPILQFLKPIIRVFNDMMRPFREAAYKMMRQSIKSGDPTLMTLAIGTLMQGFTMGILAIIGELLKMVYSTIVDMIKYIIINPVIELFKVLIPDYIVSDNTFDAVKKTIFDELDSSKIIINNTIDNALNSLKEKTVERINDILETFGESVDWRTPQERLTEKMNKMLKNAVDNVKVPSSKKSSNNLTAIEYIKIIDKSGWDDGSHPLSLKSNSGLRG